MNATPWEQLKATADAVGWPETFKKDLDVHDRSKLERPDMQDVPFVWILHSAGTHIITDHKDLPMMAGHVQPGQRVPMGYVSPTGPGGDVARFYIFTAGQLTYCRTWKDAQRALCNAQRGVWLQDAGRKGMAYADAMRHAESLFPREDP